MATVEILTTNFSGETAQITFTPCSGGTIDLGSQVLPYDYVSDNYEGSYSLYFPDFTQTCTFNIPCSDLPPTPTPTVTGTPEVTATPTITPSVTGTPEVTPTPTVTGTPEVTATPTITPSVTGTPEVTATPTVTPSPPTIGDVPVDPQDPEPSPTPTVTPSPPTVIGFLAGSICYDNMMSLHAASSSTVCTNIQGGVGLVNYYMSNCSYQTFLTGNPSGCMVYINDGVTLVGTGFLSDGCKFWEIVDGIVISTSAEICSGASQCCETGVPPDEPLGGNDDDFEGEEGLGAPGEPEPTPPGTPTPTPTPTPPDIDGGGPGVGGNGDDFEGEV